MSTHGLVTKRYCPDGAGGLAVELCPSGHVAGDQLQGPDKEWYTPEAYEQTFGTGVTITAAPWYSGAMADEVQQAILGSITDEAARLRGVTWADEPYGGSCLNRIDL